MFKNYKCKKLPDYFNPVTFLLFPTQQKFRNKLFKGVHNSNCRWGLSVSWITFWKPWNKSGAGGETGQSWSNGLEMDWIRFLLGQCLSASATSTTRIPQSAHKQATHSKSPPLSPGHMSQSRLYATYHTLLTAELHVNSHRCEGTAHTHIHMARPNMLLHYTEEITSIS